MAGETPVKDDAENEMEEGGRQRSKVAFPYMDIKAAFEVANAIHENVGNGDCSLQQLSAWMQQSIKSSGFRMQMSVARLFGVIDSNGSENYRLTGLGRRIVDPETSRKAKAEAFLTVPLFRLLYDSHKEGLLPPAAALEREIAVLGVAEKQKDRARQVFERSAELAGFFEHGRNRLVEPAVKGGAASGSDTSETKKKDERDGGGGGPNDPLISALIQKLPMSGTDWSVDDRVMWLQMMTMAFQMAYGQKENIEIKASKGN